MAFAAQRKNVWSSLCKSPDLLRQHVILLPIFFTPSLLVLCSGVMTCIDAYPGRQTILVSTRLLV